MQRSVSVALALLIAAPAAAQPKEPTTYDRAIAAGYKALTLCSGMFNGGRTQAQIEALELKGIYPQYDALLPTLKAEVSELGVAVGFDAMLPPRFAGWAPGRGCTIAPIGSTPPAHLVTLREMPPSEKAVEPRWPQGDAGITVRTPARLAAVAQRAFDEKSYGTGTTTGLVVVRNGRIIAENYADGFGPKVSQRTWSVAKSLTGTLIGAAVQRGLLSADQKSGVPEWQTDGDPRRNITIDQLLRMASGLHSETAGNRTDALYFGGTTVTQEVTAWPLDAMPGTRFRYANNDIVLVMRALRAKAGDEVYATFPQTELFDKIGMTRTVAETDWQGNFILSSQVWSTARDLARFGLLYLNDGVWNDERILPEGWVKYVTTPSGPQPEGEFGYGATFWLMSKSPGVPADTFAAFGNRGQYVVIVPSRKVVIVRRGEDPAGARFDIAQFTADVLAALE
ncbi:serine hydrolase domain-containing protein [Sphingomonas cavernae]|uniref:Class C beta-lactamase-related serine hydrolase n=1 Tax=Sphingomonas cavernae TaxID=2320861 RepID=A0A418W7H5_9SPHN|nr:serine hydrolase [Sphingomonas cavernae]RJF85834.1 class C beta-lactamase-related serine hydrolase [Sphingomonas cavernae]